MPFSPKKAPSVHLSSKPFHAKSPLASKSPMKKVSPNITLKGNRQHTSYELLEKFNRRTYQTWRDRCVMDRTSQGIGKSAQMNTLFRFWSVNLRKHYNRSMYLDFKQLALADAVEGHSYGLQCLFRFYSYGLEQQFRSALWEDFQALAWERYQSSKDLYGIEKVVAFLTYAVDRPLVHQPLEQLIESQYPTLNHFSQSSA